MPPVGTPPKIRWNAPAGLRTVTFPDYLTDFSHRYIVPTAQRETSGGVVAHYYEGAYDEVTAEWLGEFDQAFADELRAWWAHAGAGKLFEFYMEGDNINTALLFTTYVSGGIVNVNYPAGPPFPVNRELTIGPYTAAGDLAKRDAFTVTSVDESPPFTGRWDLSFAGSLPHEHLVGDLVRSKYGFPQCVCTNDSQPWREEPGRVLRVSIRFRSHADIVTP